MKYKVGQLLTPHQARTFLEKGGILKYQNAGVQDPFLCKGVEEKVYYTSSPLSAKWQYSGWSIETYIDDDESERWYVHKLPTVKKFKEGQRLTPVQAKELLEKGAILNFIDASNDFFTKAIKGHVYFRSDKNRWTNSHINVGSYIDDHEITQWNLYRLPAAKKSKAVTKKKAFKPKFKIGDVLDEKDAVKAFKEGHFLRVDYNTVYKLDSTGRLWYWNTYERQLLKATTAGVESFVKGMGSFTVVEQPSKEKKPAFKVGQVIKGKQVELALLAGFGVHVIVERTGGFDYIYYLKDNILYVQINGLSDISNTALDHLHKQYPAATYAVVESLANVKKSAAKETKPAATSMDTTMFIKGEEPLAVAMPSSINGDSQRYKVLNTTRKALCTNVVDLVRTKHDPNLEQATYIELAISALHTAQGYITLAMNVNGKGNV